VDIISRAKGNGPARSAAALADGGDLSVSPACLPRRGRNHPAQPGPPRIEDIDGILSPRSRRWI